MSIIDKYRDMGTFIMGKVEAGSASKGQSLLLMPNRVRYMRVDHTFEMIALRQVMTFIFVFVQTPVIIDQFYCDDEEVNSVYPGENVKAKLKGVEEEDISPGFVLCDVNSPVSVGKIFDAQVSIPIEFTTEANASCSLFCFRFKVVILEHKSIICPGYSAVMHIHCAAEEVNVKVSCLTRAEPARTLFAWKLTMFVCECRSSDV